MRGIISGMLRTLEHFVRPRPVTRKYPYEKRDLPERSRGLIALLLEPETSIFKCESCLMCEKACPPRAISISYKFKGGFRKRPPLAPRASYYRIRMVQTAPYGERRPMSTAVTTIPAEQEERLDLGPVRRVLRETPEVADRLTRVLYATNAAYGYLPWRAAELIAAEFGKTMTDLDRFEGWSRFKAALPTAKGPPSRAADVNTPATLGSPACGLKFRRLLPTMSCTSTRSTTPFAPAFLDAR